MEVMFVTCFCARMEKPMTHGENTMWMTERLKDQLLEEGIDEGLVEDYKQIMLCEFSSIQGQFQALFKECSNLLDTLRQLEAANIEAEAYGLNDGLPVKRAIENLRKYGELIQL